MHRPRQTFLGEALDIPAYCHFRDAEVTAEFSRAAKSGVADHVHDEAAARRRGIIAHDRKPLGFSVDRIVH